jgi:hypothetical protein
MADYMHISDEEMRRTREQTPFFAFVAAFTFQVGCRTGSARLGESDDEGEECK